ncbi:YpmS family protein [Bacillus norwichensis]|uniref:YpmS family protein n=1 Tax=Bacillus norwichensis TaxID=2762217 RepID=A0ABR8VJD5_9BACI|nr:YpmS family protein [Bacillus norwichensis]MBD8004889.1 YpmS family protein [Bacillus norwichensis]
MGDKNYWKIGFLILAAVNLIFICGIGLLLFLSSDQTEIPKNTTDTSTYSEFTIETRKEDLNDLINYYIEEEGLNGPIHYNVFLTDEVELYGEVSVFSQALQLKMTFEPKALDNGDLVLEQKDVYLGDVKLPVSYIMKFIRDAYKLPSWVIIQPNDQQIYVALQEMRLNNGIQVRVQEFDLARDRISMKMLVPTE